MTAPTSLLRDLGNYLAGRGSLILLGFVTFPLLTRMLTVNEYGIVSLSLKLVLLLVVLSKCGLQYSAARFFDASRSGLEDRRRFYSTLLLCPLFTSVVVSGFYAAFILQSAHLRSDALLFRCLLLAPLVVVLRTLQSMLLSFLRNEGRSRLHTVVEVLTKTTTLFAFIALAVAGRGNSFAVLSATIASETLVVAIQLTAILRRGLIRISAVDWHLIRESLVFGVPLIAYELSSLVLDSADRLIVQRYAGDHALGLYSAAYGISGYLQDTVMTPLNLALFPIYIRLWNDQGKEATARFLSNALSWFLVVAFFIIGASTLCSRQTLILLASRRFLGAERLLLVLIPALMVYALHIFFNVGLILQKRTTSLAGIAVAAALVNLAANLYWVPRMGLMGAAAATLLSYVVMVAGLMVLNHKILPLRVRKMLVCSALVAMFLAYPLSAPVHSRWIVLEVLGRAGIYALLFASCLAILSRDFRKIAHRAMTKASLLVGTRFGIQQQSPLSEAGGAE